MLDAVRAEEAVGQDALVGNVAENRIVWMRVLPLSAGCVKVKAMCAKHTKSQA